MCVCLFGVWRNCNNTTANNNNLIIQLNNTHPQPAQTDCYVCVCKYICIIAYNYDLLPPISSPKRLMLCMCLCLCVFVAVWCVRLTRVHAWAICEERPRTHVIFSMWEFPVTSKHTNKLATLQHLSSSSYMLLYVHKSTLVAIWRRVRVRRNPFGLLSATLYIARVQSVEGILNFKHWHAHGAWKRHSKTSYATSLHSKKNHTSPTPSPAHHHHPNALRTNSRVRLIATQRHQWIVMCVCFFVCVCRRDIYHFDILQQYAEQCWQYG